MLKSRILLTYRNDAGLFVWIVWPEHKKERSVSRRSVLLESAFGM